DERRDMVLAVALDADVAQHHQVIIAADLLERRLLEHGYRVFAITAEVLLERLDDTARRFLQALAIRVVTGPCDERAHGFFGLLLGWPAGVRHLVFERGC